MPTLGPETTAPEAIVKEHDVAPEGCGFAIKVARDGTMGGARIEAGTPRSVALAALNELAFEPETILGFSYGLPFEAELHQVTKATSPFPTEFEAHARQGEATPLAE